MLLMFIYLVKEKICTNAESLKYFIFLKLKKVTDHQFQVFFFYLYILLFVFRHNDVNNIFWLN